eukprot:CAMPEP_0170622288 /NCGR_PEP_ID=MMETSP0224-20130122/29048_1 /TAXON_ID=285029 /ORGANISM="Togula jolla, Strain CCCM 725" /LENGTH=122 /DNA_ID=CAMNT_0010948591 /DNA_START=27 /DNA_END=395 /DNA_ORIENTATION=-
MALMKEIGLKGGQMKNKRDINRALFMLQAQKVVYKVKQNPIRWEIHEEYRKNGVPRISNDERAPFKLMHNIKFKSTKVPKYGPVHGEYRPNTPDLMTLITKRPFSRYEKPQYGELTPAMEEY